MKGPGDCPILQEQLALEAAEQFVFLVFRPFPEDVLGVLSHIDFVDLRSSFCGLPEDSRGEFLEP